MGKIVWGLVLGGVMTGLYVWANATVPGGEKRYEQYLRLVMSQHDSGAIPKLANY